METITDSLKKMSLPSADSAKNADSESSSRGSSESSRGVQQTAGTCPHCSGVGWVVLDVPKSDARWGKAVPCKCKRDEIAARRARKLQAVDGLREAALLSAEDVTALQEIYKAYRATAHRLALQKQAGEVSADQLLAERRKVRHIWQALGLN